MKLRWANDEIEYLKTHYPYKDKQTLSNEMGRTAKAIQTMAVRLKIRKVIISRPKVRKVYNVIGKLPELGQIKQAAELGRPGEARYIWQACKDCGKERWVQLEKRGPRKLRCYLCAMKSQRGQGNPNWKGGKVEAGVGYIAIKLQPDDFFFPMADYQGYVLEHRLIMARKLGRCLQPWEKVHHKDGNRSHNVDSNLKLTTAGSHAIEHNKGYRDGYQQGYLDGQNVKIEELRKEIKLLQWQLKQLIKEEVL